MFEIVETEEFSRIFSRVGDGWMLITAGDAGEENTMTASWGCFGVLWNRPVCVCFVRPQRYTKEKIDACERLSLTFFDEKYRDVLAYCGKVSGRDEDKIRVCGLTVAREGDVPYFEEARTALLCRKLYVGKLEESGFLDPSLLSHYAARDYHAVYVCEIEKVLERKEERNGD